MGSAFQDGSDFVYDLKNSRRLDDYAEVKNLGGIFFAARKEGEDQFSIFEMADRDMKTPLVKVDACQVIHQIPYTESKVTSIVFTIGDSQYRYEITPEKKLKPIAKKVGEKLFLSTGSQWVDASADGLSADISFNYISLERKYEYPSKFRKNSKSFKLFGGHCLSNDEARALAHLLAKTVNKEIIREEIPKEIYSYHNAKERLKGERSNSKNSKSIPPQMPKGRDDR